MRKVFPSVVLVVAVIVVAVILIDGHSHGTRHRTSATAPATPISSPPTLRENFTLLACSPDTTLGLEGCAEHRLLAEDQLINDLRDQVFLRLFDNGARHRFVLAEVDWFYYRRSACQSESDSNDGGSLVPVDFANCAVRLDLQHVAELRVQIASYAIGQLG